MKESVIYQEWRAEALQEGLEEGRKQGIQEGEATLVLRILQRKLAAVPAAVAEEIRSLPPQRLEALGEALLEFQSLEDLTAWLASSGETS